MNDGKTESWTRDARYNVLRVGDELYQTLKTKYGIDTIHNGTVHDYPNSNSAYVRSRSTVTKIISGNPSIRIMIDLHRDGLKGNKKLRAVKEINKKNAAQIMFVIGAGNPNWRENFKLAVKLQNKLNEICPGLAKPIFISENTYNQNIINGALIAEIGGDGNLISESVESAKYLARAISEVAKVNK